MSSTTTIVYQLILWPLFQDNLGLSLYPVIISTYMSGYHLLMVSICYTVVYLHKTPDHEKLYQLPLHVRQYYI